MQDLKGTLFSGLAAATFCFATTTSVNAQELRLAHFSPPTHFLHTDVFEPFSEMVAEQTNGETTVRIFPAGELGAGPVEQLNRVLSGIADMALVIPGYNTSQFPMTLVAELPGSASNPAEIIGRLWDSTDLLEDEYADVHLISLWSTDGAILMTRDTPVRSMADLEGMKIRVPSANAGRIVEAWGASPVFMSSVELYNALQTGIIDGTIGSATLVQSYRLDEVLEYYVLGVPAMVTTMNMVMNRSRWDSLSAHSQEVLTELGQGFVSDAATNGYMSEALDVIDRMRAADGETVIQLSDEVIAELMAAAEPVRDEIVAELVAAGHPAQELSDRLH